MRKGIVTIQLNWILILIVGAVVLAFFAGVIRSASRLSAEKTNVLLLNTLDDIANSVKSGEKLDRPEESIPETDIEYNCRHIGDRCSCSFTIGGRAQGFDDPTIILFAPSRMETPTLLVKSMDWNFPFRVANFLYFTSTKTKYVFVYNAGSEDLKELIIKNIHTSLKKEEYAEADISDFKDKNDNRVKFVFVNAGIDSQVAAELEDMRDENVNAVYINGNEDSGTVEFYQKDDDDWMQAGSAPYIGLPALLGAVFIDESPAEETENFLCLEAKSFETLSMVAGAYAGRSSKIYDAYQAEEPPNSVCSTIHSNAINSLQGLSSETSNPYGSDLASIIGNIINSIASYPQALQDINNNALSSSCALVY